MKFALYSSPLSVFILYRTLEKNITVKLASLLHVRNLIVLLTFSCLAHHLNFISIQAQIFVSENDREGEAGQRRSRRLLGPRAHHRNGGGEFSNQVENVICLVLRTAGVSKSHNFFSLKFSRD